MHITKNSRGYDDCIVYRNGDPIENFEWANEETGEVMVLTRNNKPEVLRGEIKIVLNAGSSRFK
jgi:hypothetical protein